MKEESSEFGSYKLGDVLKVKHGRNQKEVLSPSGPYPIIGSGGEFGRASEFLHNQPSVLIGRKGTIDRPLFMRTPFWVVDTMFYTEFFDGFDPKYIFYLFQSIDWRSKNEASGVPSLSGKIIEEIEVSLPNYRTQKVIAKALSDIDELIEVTNNEIRKYQDLFQAMMEMLLNPAKNSTATFDIRRLGDMAEIVPGGTPSTSVAEFWNGGHLWATPTDITATKGKYITTTNRKISPAGLKYVSKILPVGSILLCTRATIGESKITLFPITTNQGFKNLIPFKGIDNEWLYYILKTKINEMKSLSSGSTFLELGTKNLANIEVSTPSSQKQMEFGKALSEVDELIEVLSMELAKYECIKQGMAHDLLTGKVRLV